MPVDIKIADNNDVEIINGDFVANESTYQHQTFLLLANKGEFKENPARCVGAIRYCETGDREGFAREISTEFSRDGMEVHRLDIEIPNVNIEAEYDY